jgi:hypothetical protein
MYTPSDWNVQLDREKEGGMHFKSSVLKRADVRNGRHLKKADDHAKGYEPEQLSSSCRKLQQSLCFALITSNSSVHHRERSQQLILKLALAASTPPRTRTPTIMHRGLLNSLPEHPPPGSPKPHPVLFLTLRSKYILYYVLLLAGTHSFPPETSC